MLTVIRVLYNVMNYVIQSGLPNADAINNIKDGRIGFGHRKAVSNEKCWAE